MGDARPPDPPGIYRFPPVWTFLLALFESRCTINLLVPEDRAIQGWNAAPSPVWTAVRWLRVDNGDLD